MPAPEKKTKNYFKNPEGVKKCRDRFHSEIKKGRMIGGRGWTRKTVKWFLGREFYIIPCGAVPKNDDEYGRIIHNNSYPHKSHFSVNSALTNTSVEYITFKERVALLEEVDWYGWPYELTCLPA